MMAERCSDTLFLEVLCLLYNCMFVCVPLVVLRISFSCVLYWSVYLAYSCHIALLFKVEYLSQIKMNILDLKVKYFVRRITLKEN